jgi:vitamin B12 transporter
MKQKMMKEKVPVVFRKWNNKGYAVFRSLNQVIKISALSLAYLLFANPGEAKVNGTDTTSVTRNYDLESIDVTSEQLPETYSNISRVVVTITQNDIERAAVSSVNELLEYAANIDIRQRGIDGVQADVSIRGGTFDQVLVLLNGINITDPQTGHHNLNLPVDLSAIERIEILKGPGAWKFGPGAFSGAINIITKPVQKSFIKAEASAGQFAYNNQKLSVGLKTSNSSQLLSASRMATDGHTNNTDYLQKEIFYQGKLFIKANELSLQAGASDKAFGANSFYTAMYPNQYEEIQTYFVSAAFKGAFKNIKFDPKIYYRRNNDRFLLFRDNPPAYSNFHTTDVYGASLLTVVTLGTNAVTTFGVDRRIETIYSNNLGEIIEKTRFSPVNDTILLNRYHSRANFSAFAGYKQYFNQLTVSVGLNLTHNSDLNDQWFLYPGIDLSYELSPSSSVFASANRTMRMPTFTDMYYKSPMNEGNPAPCCPNLPMAMSWVTNISMKLLRLSATGFYIAGENMIDWVRETVHDKWRTINYTQLNILPDLSWPSMPVCKKAFPSQSRFLTNIGRYSTLLSTSKSP